MKIFKNLNITEISMKLSQDPRIDVKSLSIRNYIIALCCVLVIFGGYGIVTYIQMKSFDYPYELRFAISLIYIPVASIVILIIYSLIRKYKFMNPLNQLGEAARRVAKGDYSYRIPPHRKDGKKDEFEILYEDFNTMAEELASTEIMKTDFISSVSHELKTPLAVIQNYATILQDPSLTEEERLDYTTRISDAAKRLTVLVSDILELSRIENKKIVTKSEPFNLSEELCRCSLNYEEKWEEKNIDFETELDQSIILKGDEDLLDMVWNNLISNALKFTPDDGMVTVTARREEESIAVSVADTGCGIEPEALGHIYDKFYQADESHAQEGNGLGLSIVKEILDLVGGTIEVDSTPGQGSTFTVRFPRKTFEVSTAEES